MDRDSKILKFLRKSSRPSTAASARSTTSSPPRRRLPATVRQRHHLLPQGPNMGPEEDAERKDGENNPHPTVSAHGRVRLLRLLHPSS